MYREHFELKERPFTHAPGQRFYAANAAVSDALGRLQHVLSARDAIALVTGGPGVGKTTLAECALAAMPDRTSVARVDLRYGEAADLYAAILLALDADAAGLTPVQAMNSLRQTMTRLMREDRRLILCLNIGGISTDIAKHLLRVANLAGERDGQMNILLMGPHPLHQQLDVPALIQLRQRIAFRHRVRPLTLAETDRYIRHQFEAVGGDATALMSGNVAAAVYCYVAGVPRLINTLLDATLSDAALQKLRRPDGSLIKRTADGLGWKPMTPPQTAAETAQRPASQAAHPAASRSSIPKVATAIFRAAEPPPRPTATPAGLVPAMNESDTSATGMLRLQDLDDRFAETIFGKDAEELLKKQAD